MTSTMIYLWAVGVWFVFLVIAFGVGAVREGVMRPRNGKPKSHVIATLIAVSLMMLVIYVFIQRVHESCSMTELILIGVLWLIMTVAFEFGFPTTSWASLGKPCWLITTSCEGGSGCWC